MQVGSPSIARAETEDAGARDVRFHLALAQAPLILWTTDRDLIFASGSGAGLEALHVRPGDAIGKGVLDVFGDTPTGASILAYHKRALAGESVRYEMDWMDRWYDTSMEPLRASDGSIVGVIGVAVDFTERKRAEDALRESEQRFQLLARATSDMSWDWNLVTDNIWRRDRLRDVLGYTAEDMEPTGSWWEQNIHPDDRERVVGTLHAAIEHKDPSWTQEYRWRRHDGTYLTIQDRGYLICDRAGKPVHMVGSTADVTAQRREDVVREAIYRISEAAVAAKDLPALYAELHRIVGGLMPAQNFYIARYDPETDMLSFPYFVDEEEAAPAPYKAGRGLTEYVLRMGKPFYASAEGYERLVSLGEVVRIGPTSIDWVGVPLIAQGRTIGVLVVQTYREGVRYGEVERDILTYVSEQIAMAIERKRTEAALVASEDKFRRLVEQNLAGIYIIQGARFVYVNPRLAEIFGYAPNEIIGILGPVDLTTPEDRARVTENIRRRIEGEISSIGYSFHGVRKDGTRIFLEVRGSVMDFNGRPAIIGSLTDVTQREMAVEELRRSEARFRALFEAAADPILLVNRQGVILDANPATVSMAKLGREDLVGQPLARFIPETDLARARNYLQECFRGGSTSGSFEVTVVLPGGGRRLLAVRSRLVSEAGAPPYLEMMLRDVTDQQEMQRRLVESERLASLGQMAAYVAHEINTPLANISLLVASMQRREKDPGILEKLEKLNIQRRQAAGIISDLLSFSKQRQIEPVEVDLRDVIIASLDQVEPYRAPGVALRAELDEDPVLATVDPLQMQEVFTNLLKNALEATTAGSVTIRLVSRADAHVVEVVDTGPGIPPDIRERLFQPFYTTKRRLGGTGLGLALCRNIVDAHRGTIHVASEVGKGSTFTVVLPRGAVH